MKQKYILDYEINQPSTCYDCKYRFWDELLNYCFCQINQRPYLKDVNKMWECDGYYEN